MNIALFTDSFLPHVSGVCTAVINQANELSKQGHSVMIFRPKAFGAAGKKRLENSGELSAKIRNTAISVPSLRQPGLRIAIPTVALSLPTLKRFNPDVIHVHTEWGCGWEGVMLAKMLRKPLVGTFHTFFAEPEYLRQFHLPNHRLTQKMMWRYSVFFYNHCDRILSPSRSVAEQLVARGALRVPHLLSNGIPAYALRPDADIAAERQALDLKGPTFIYVGRLSEEKSLPVLLKAFARVYRHRNDAELVVVGHGIIRENLMAFAQELGIAASVRFTGSVPHAELMKRNLHRVGQIFVTASKTENQPVSLLEAMALGLPVIGPDAKGIPEMIRHEETGLLFPPEDDAAMAAAMLRLLEDPALRSHCGQKALAFANANGIVEIVQQLQGHYAAVIEEKRLRREKRRQRLRALSARRVPKSSDGLGT